VVRAIDIRRPGEQGFTLIEIVLVIVIIGVLAAVAMRAGVQIFDTARVEETKQELDVLAKAIVGDERMVNNGVRADFGYVGDVGALPPGLDALAGNPGGYASWNGPYIADRFAEAAGDYRTDPWGSAYAYGGTTITSNGSGSTIVRRLAGSADELLHNRVMGTVLDLDGTPPGPVYADSVHVLLTVPDGLGGWTTRSTSTDIGGFFSFDSIPIGNHDLRIIYEPNSDTLNRFVSVTPGSRAGRTYLLTDNLWYASAGIPGLVGHYPLDETSGLIAHDLSGQALDADLQNNPGGSGWTTGQVDGCFEFDGVNDYFETAATATELQITQDYTLSVWIYAETSQMTWAAIICRCTPSGNDNHWTLQWDNSSGTSKRLTIYHPNGGNWRSSYTLTDAQNAWHHIVVTYRRSPALIRLYIDGAFHSESSSLTQPPGSGLGKFRIGCDRVNYVYHGRIDDVRIYNRVLTEGEITALYNLQQPGIHTDRAGHRDCHAGHRRYRGHAPPSGVGNLGQVRADQVGDGQPRLGDHRPAGCRGGRRPE
jgi:prepilin-type N-terminal cleavage/methylation domain-containing protein